MAKMLEMWVLIQKSKINLYYFIKNQGQSLTHSQELLNLNSGTSENHTYISVTNLSGSYEYLKMFH